MPTQKESFSEIIDGKIETIKLISNKNKIKQKINKK